MIFPSSIRAMTCSITCLPSGKAQSTLKAIRGDHLVGDGDAEVRAANPREEIGDPLFASHQVLGARRRDVPVLYPFGVVGVELRPMIQVLARRLP